MYKPHRVIAPGNFDETFYALEQGDLSYAYWNPQTDQAPPAPVMLYCGSDWLDANSAKKVETYVRNGGTLVTFSRYPTLDDCGAPLAGLPFDAPEGARPTNLPVTISYRKGTTCLRKGGHCGRKVNFAYFRKVADTPIYLTLSTEAKETLVDIGPTDVDSFTIGYTKKLGKGKIVYLGSNPSPEILRLVLEQEGLGPYSQAEDTDFTTSVFRRRDGALVLFLVSRCAASRVVTTRLNTKRLGLVAAKTYTLENAETGETRRVKGRDLAEIALPLGGFDVSVWIIQ
jgi:hypothetical protein